LQGEIVPPRQVSPAEDRKVNGPEPEREKRDIRSGEVTGSKVRAAAGTEGQKGFAGNRARSRDMSLKAEQAARPAVNLPGGEDVGVTAKKTDETDIVNMYNLALKEGDKGNIAEARRLYLAILAERSGYIEALNNLGVLAMKEGNGKEAIFYFKKTLELKKDYGKAYNNIGLVLLKEGDKRQAEWNFRKAMETGQDAVEPCVNLSALYRNDRRLGEASRLLEALLNRGEKSPVVHLSYAIVKDEMGEPALAIAHYRYYLREVGSSGRTNPVVERLKTLETTYPRTDR